MAEIEFDPNKDESNLRKHGIRLARASDFWPVAVLEDTRKDYGETRYRGFGFIVPPPVRIVRIDPRAEYRPEWAHSGRIELVVWSIPALTVILLGGVAWIGSHQL